MTTPSDGYLSFESIMLHPHALVQMIVIRLFSIGDLAAVLAYPSTLPYFRLKAKIRLVRADRASTAGPR